MRISSSPAVPDGVAVCCKNGAAVTITTMGGPWPPTEDYDEVVVSVDCFVDLRERLSGMNDDPL